jgi:hypothetical protein
MREPFNKNNPAISAYPRESNRFLVYFRFSNQYAPVVLRARTLRKEKTNQFSDTYQTVRLQGGYDVIDSCYLSAHENYSNANNLSHKRDSLSISGRDDVKHHIKHLSKTKDSMTYLPKENIDEKLQMATEQYPNLSSTCSSVLAASTYISVKEAVALQEFTYNQSSISLSITENDWDKEGIQLFDPPWPLKTVRVHPYNEFGERFNGVSDPGGSFNIWSHVSVVLCVDDMWTFLTDSLKTDSDPEGYLLSLAWKQIKSRGGENHKGTKFFSFTKKRKKILIQKKLHRLWRQGLI